MKTNQNKTGVGARFSTRKRSLANTQRVRAALSALAQHPEFSFYEIGRALGVAWKTTDHKEHYQKLAAADKERARQEREVWEATRPKRAISAYAFFVKHNRQRITEAHPGADFAQIGKLLGVAWKECPDRQRFEEMAARDKIRCELSRAHGLGSAPYTVDTV